MPIVKAIQALLILLISGLCLTGCHSLMGNETMPHGDMTMTEIYNQTTGLSKPENGGTLPQPAFQTINHYQLPQSRVPHYSAYTRTATNEVQSLFKPINNPEIPVYIYPHLAYLGSDAVPVPGYTTDFFLYTRNHFATPEEVY